MYALRLLVSIEARLQVLTLMTIAFLIALSISDTSSAHSLVLSYQGRLLNNDGTPLDSSVHSFRFRIYNDSMAGHELWSTNGFVPLLVVDGLFSHDLGSTNPLPDSLADCDELWLGVSVDLDPEITPRARLGGSLFALTSLRATYADTSVHSLDRTISAGDLIEGTLSLDRFSAYEDLIDEDRIGPGAGQLAAGDHEHPASGFTIVRDDNPATVTLVAPSGEITLKTITLPASSVNNLLRIHIIYSKTGLSYPELRVRLNNQFVWAQSAIYLNSQFMGAMILKTGSGDSWLGRDYSGGGNLAAFSIAAQMPWSITITGELTGGTSEVTIQTVWLEFY